ncbi:serine/threonine-protein kinase pim-2-like [Eucyclogobius newberryi]|uniref:serine/threonine-protein kinase pim-2-like n=1 Tax=Eucyclogobius newberryi TaxID=166745 RepID=UPI003B5A6F05
MNKAAPGQDSTGLNPAVSFLDWFILDQNKIILVMERPTPSEDLYIYSLENAPLPEEQAKELMQQVVDALVDIYSKGVFHGDVKIDNLLVQSTESGPRMRIIDFGCGCMIKHPTYQNETLIFAPRKYKNRPYLAAPLTVTQIGSVLYRLLTSDDSELSPLDLMDGNISTRSDLSKECIDFLNFCITWDLEQRICLDQLRHHPWFYA